MPIKALSRQLQIETIPVTAFSGFGGSKLAVQSSGSIGTNMEVGLSANTDAATFEGGTGITAERNLVATSPVEGAYSAGAGNPYLVEIGSLGFMGLLMDTAGDDIRHIIPIPVEWDVRHGLKFRTIWSSEAAAVAARDITWKVLYGTLGENDTIAAPSTALDTAIAVDPPTGTAKQIQLSPWGVMNAGGIAETDLFLSLIVEMDAFDATFTESKYLLGLQIEYSPKPYKGKFLQADSTNRNF